MLEALSREFREGLPMEFLYVDDLVLITGTNELLLEKCEKMERGDGKRMVWEWMLERQKSCGGTGGWARVKLDWFWRASLSLWCLQGVGNNSIFCVVCLRWVQKRCSEISRIRGVLAMSIASQAKSMPWSTPTSTKNFMTWWHTWSHLRKLWWVDYQHALQ